MFNKGVKPLNLQHILVVRTDRIGDVVLTLPTVEVLKQHFPNAKISMMVSPYTAPLIEGVADILRYSKEKSFFDVLQTLRQAQIDAAVIAYPRFRLALLLWLAGIRIRVGTGYRWYSFLFNRRVYEHRKTVARHESEYNLNLLREIGCTFSEIPRVRIPLSAEARQVARDIRTSLGIEDQDSLVLLHPGSGGSARDWKPERFAQLASELCKKGYRVVVTGGQTEEALVRRVAALSGKGVQSYVSLVGLKEFAAFIATAKLFIANSTGPLHIAAVVATPVVGFYPPVKVMSPKRWGPLTQKKKIFVPDPVQCPRCHGGECQGNECMELIQVQDVVTAALDLLNEKD